MQRVRVLLEATAEVRATLAAQKISVQGGTSGSSEPEPRVAQAFTAQVPEADTPEAAGAAVRKALRRWGDVPVEPLGSAQ
jgi:hypothetical protein